jgi:hypothetical protein
MAAEKRRQTPSGRCSFYKNNAAASAWAVLSQGWPAPLRFAAERSRLAQGGLVARRPLMTWRVKKKFK